MRCAIYCRKSVEDGLEQEFNSLDAQREAGESYSGSQKANGWVCLPERYDDGGFSGGNTNRPALQKLLADIQDGTFAKDFLLDMSAAGGQAHFRAMRKLAAEHPSEVVGKEIRKLYSWNNEEDKLINN